eukprot:1157787-Pelagomonas_calceolata.AAC.6
MPKKLREPGWLCWIQQIRGVPRPSSNVNQKELEMVRASRNWLPQAAASTPRQLRRDMEEVHVRLMNTGAEKPGLPAACNEVIHADGEVLGLLKTSAAPPARDKAEKKA